MSGFPASRRVSGFPSRRVAGSRRVSGFPASRRVSGFPSRRVAGSRRVSGFPASRRVSGFPPWFQGKAAAQIAFV